MLENPLQVANLLREQPAFFIAVSVVFGLLVGSFLNVVIHRLPRMMEQEWRQQCAELNGQETAKSVRYNLVTPRSACPACGHNIGAWENIPLLSYLALGGKCSACKIHISARYPLVEGLTGLLAGLIAWRFGFSGMTVAAWLFAFSLIALTFIDFDTQLLPDDITLPLIWAGLLYNLDGGFASLSSAVTGAVAGYLMLWSIYWLFKLATGKEGMGYGDFKLLAAIGAWFGWQMLPAVILLSSLGGSVIGIGLIVLARHGRNVPVPFGPYLALGGIAALFWGPQLAHLYLL
ncbi:MAG TPA: A24 family peptidase [Methylophilaceae bacterium]|nr:A24 family peptidase [Methylophilaceae bacterium]HQR59885.1 A24 family peptidase [Methylophilaceae bacterium]